MKHHNSLSRLAIDSRVRACKVSALPHLHSNVLQYTQGSLATSLPRSGSDRSTKSSARAVVFVSLAGFVLYTTKSNLNSISECPEDRLASSWLHEDTKDERHDSTSVLADTPPATDLLFAYPSLVKDNKTRLLILEPGSFKEALKCRLKGVVHLEEHPYEALSYFWGKSPGRIIESFSGKIIQITANLEAALRRIRHTTKSRLLWVDAICIDQSDFIGRSRQVEIMQEIYASAKRVIIWLGEESVRDSLAFKSLIQLKKGVIWRVDLRHMVCLGWYRDKKSGRVFSGGANRSILSDIEYEHLINLLRRD